MNIGSSNLLDFILKNNFQSSDLLDLVTVIAGNGSFDGNNQGNVIL